MSRHDKRVFLQPRSIDLDNHVPSKTDLVSAAYRRLMIPAHSTQSQISQVASPSA